MATLSRSGLLSYSAQGPSYRHRSNARGSLRVHYHYMTTSTDNDKFRRASLGKHAFPRREGCYGRDNNGRTRQQCRDCKGKGGKYVQVTVDHMPSQHPHSHSRSSSHSHALEAVASVLKLSTLNWYRPVYSCCTSLSCLWSSSSPSRLSCSPHQKKMVTETIRLGDLVLIIIVRG